MNNDEHRELLMATIESTADGIYISGLGGKYLLSNSRFHEMVKVSLAETVYVKHRDVFEMVANQLENPLPFLYWVHDLLKSPKVDLFIVRFTDGRIFECYSVPLVRDGKNSGRVWTFSDITRLKKTEETAKLYLDLMSHDIRNRLQGLVMSVEILHLMVDNPDSELTIIDLIASELPGSGTYAAKNITVPQPGLSSHCQHALSVWRN